MSDPELLNPVMGPPVVNESSFTEFWPLSVNYDVRLPFNSGQDFISRGELFGYSGNSYISAAEESTVTEQTGGGRKRRALTSQSKDESSKMMLSSCTTVNRSKESSKKKMKVCLSEGETEDGLRREGETSSGGGSKETEDKSPPKDYIHVRARRGQATDRHSLAERLGSSSSG
ncbi:hypothetical protein ISN44_As10g015780 [Arabidopsis suecica]|uniref:Uncharacterized protein n=1 Tax=Arabidopsis suecica TaxID=45249 RepID=A0A8T1ZVE4_ARASU|nr:hypothetical protein ISN44_As10g015780 [Arabidopsis suecica]